MQDLLHILALETGQKLSPSLTKSKAGKKSYSSTRRGPPKPLTVEELLNKPFYTVETNEEPSEVDAVEDDDTFTSAVVSDSDYRNLMSDMLLGIKIQAPEQFKDLSIGELLGQMPWTSDPDLGRSIQDQIRFCLLYTSPSPRDS